MNVTAASPSSRSARAKRGVYAMAVVMVTALLIELCAVTASADTVSYAPVDRPGPQLSISKADLRSALVCSPNVGHSTREPVLMVPGTFMTFQGQFGWSWAHELTRLGIPWCGVTPPHQSAGDAQVAGEYIVFAIRYLYHASHDRKIAIVGHSQGATTPRWSLRFWPGVRGMVADDVGVAPANQGVSLRGGTPVATGLCGALGTCPLIIYQAAAGSSFIKAMNSGREMFPGIAYSVIYSTTDELVAPKDTMLYGRGTYGRVSLQQVCPGHVADHVLDGTIDPVTWALVHDAITHRGPARASRISHSVCGRLYMPGLTPISAVAGLATAGASLATGLAQAPMSDGEPRLRCYVFAACRRSRG